MTDKPHQDHEIFFNAAEEAISRGEAFDGMSIVDGFNVAARHVTVLLGDATEAYERKSYGTSVFLAIIALEETAKAEILIFRMTRGPVGRKNGTDPLRNHKKKLVIAVRPTTFMGRLPKLLGNQTCARLQHEAESGALVILRERALYAHADRNGVTSPASVISMDCARETLLLALESADDVLVGWTYESYTLGEQFEKWIATVS